MTDFSVKTDRSFAPGESFLFVIDSVINCAAGASFTCGQDSTLPSLPIS